MKKATESATSTRLQTIDHLTYLSAIRVCPLIPSDLASSPLDLPHLPSPMNANQYSWSPQRCLLIVKDKFQISDDTLLQRRRDLTSAEVDGEALILDAESGRCVELDAIGTLIWGGLAKETSLAKLVDSLCYAFGNSVARETCRKDTLKLLSVLRKNGFLLLGKPEPLQQLSPTPDCTDKGAKNGVFDDLFWRTKECDASERRLSTELVLPRMEDLLDEHPRITAKRSLSRQ